MARIGLGTKGRRVGLIPDSPNMSALKAIVDQSVAAEVAEATSVSALTALGVPVQIHSESVAGVAEDNSGGTSPVVEVMAGPITVECPGPVRVRVDSVLRKTGAPDVDLYFRVNGDATPTVSGDTLFIDVMLGDWPDGELIPYTREITVNTEAGTHTFDFAAIVFAGTNFEMGIDGPNTRFTVFTTPNDTAFDMPGPIAPPE